VKGRSFVSTCPHDCPDTCSFVTEVVNGRATTLKGRADHPVTRGWLCSKVNAYLEHVYSPDRLTHPLRRVGAKGHSAGERQDRWQRITWDEAIDEIASRWREIIAEYGAEAILPYSSTGTLGLVQMTVSSARLWNWLGASRLRRSICGAAGKQAAQATIGARIGPAYEDVLHSRLIILWGHNPVVSGPHIVPFLKKARRQGTRLIVIDPRRSETAELADLHIAPVPGADAALALGMAHVAVVNGWYDEEWLNANTVGWVELRQRLEEYHPRRVAEITGVPEAMLKDLAREYATLRPAHIRISEGLQRHLGGGQAVRAICTLPAITGQYGVLGGGLGYGSSDEFSWDDDAVEHWAECPPPAREVNMNRLGAALLGEVAGAPIQSLYVFGANPVASSPNAGRIVEGLLRPDLFTVVHELFLTDTTDYADIVLPATSQLEQVDLHKAYGYSGIGYNQAAIPPLGESKSNWEVMGLLARAMGCDRSWMYQTVDEVIDEVLRASAVTQPALEGLSAAQLQQDGFVHLRQPGETPFADLRFPTSSGKVELYSRAMLEAGIDPLPGWFAQEDWAPPTSEPGGVGPLTLISAAGQHFVSSTFGGSAFGRRRQVLPAIEINPTDAAAGGISDGDLVVVENGRGWCHLQAKVVDTVRPGVAATPKGHWSKLDPWADSADGRNVNWTTSDALGDLGGQSTFHSNRVWVRRWNQE
jgi:anaerobic selenocysteine-containing dehydrogenase